MAEVQSLHDPALVGVIIQRVTGASSGRDAVFWTVRR
jgi:hypothetical protein